MLKHLGDFMLLNVRDINHSAWRKNEKRDFFTQFVLLSDAVSFEMHQYNSSFRFRGGSLGQQSCSE
jgi:hypothetical protein